MTLSAETLRASTESDAFTRRGGVMHADGVSLDVIAEAVGTPCYVYCAATIESRFRRLQTAFADVPHRIHFAMKANSSHAILQQLQRLGAGADIVSGGELYRAQSAGFTGRDIVFSGVGKTVAEIEQALDASVLLINVESEAELITIDAVAGARGVVAPIAIRVNPEVTVDTPHAYIKTGEKGQKFGIPRDDVERIAALARSLPHVALRGLGMHLGSQISNAEPLRNALPRLLDVLTVVRAQGHEIAYLDVGGGLAVPYAPSDPRADVEDYARLIIDATRNLHVQLVLEPGRFLVADAGVLLMRVLYRKHAAGKDFVVTDAGMNDLMRPSLYQAYHGIEPVREVAASVTADVVGPICESGDFYAKDRTKPT